MPYIEADDRDALEPKSKAEPTKTGELNYQITMLLVNYTQKHGLSYGTVNDVLGALEGAKLEYYRRVAVPYEQRKFSENGDVYPSSIAP